MIETILVIAVSGVLVFSLLFSYFYLVRNKQISTWVWKNKNRWWIKLLKIHDKRILSGFLYGMSLLFIILAGYSIFLLMQIFILLPYMY